MASYPKVRVYGDFADCCSWGRVAAGMAIGLEANGALGGTCQIRDLASDEGSPEVGGDAEVAIYIGPPNYMGIMKTVGNHRERLFFVAANSTWLPDEMMRQVCRSTTGIVAPSTWARNVVRSQGYGFPCYLWHHGVDEVFDVPSETVAPTDQWLCLHMTSTTMERKSTKALIEGWGLALKSGALGNVRLDIVTTASRPTARHVLDTAKSLGVAELLDTVRVTNRKNLSTWRAARFFSGYHAVCQPSRAEGFGLVPLEARACGIVAIMTDCTGHYDHATGPGVVHVASGGYEPIDDGPGARAPSVRAEDIAKAIVDAYARRDELAAAARGHAAEIRSEWSWPRVTKRWLNSMFYTGE